MTSRLTTYLVDGKVENSPYNTNRPRCLKPELPVPDNQKISLTTLRRLQWIIYRVFADATSMTGSNGELFNGATTVNPADAITWEVVSVSGSTAVLRLPGRPDPRVQTIYSIFQAEANLGIARFQIGQEGVIQPGDRAEFVYPSALWAKSMPTVVRVTACDWEETQRITVLFDQDVSNATTLGDAYAGTPATWYVKTWRHGDYEKWQRITPPGSCQGQRTRLKILLADLDGNDSKTYNYPLLDPVADTTFKVRGYNGSAWVDITSQFTTGHLGRFRVATTGETSWNSRFFFGATDHLGNSLGADLTATYSAFVVAGVKLQPDKPAGRGARWCSNRCKYSVRDYNNGVDNYAADYGTATRNGTEHWYCARRKWTTTEQADNDSDGVNDTIVYTENKPTGGDNYQALCLQYGNCDEYAPLETGDTGSDPFTVPYTYARLLRQLWFSCREKLSQGFPGYADVRTWAWSMVGNSSLAAALGHYTLTPPQGMHETIVFPNNGSIAGKYSIDVDNNGDEVCTWRHGAFWDLRAELADVSWIDPDTYPGPGLLNEFVPKFEQQMDPVDYTTTLDSVSDLSGDKRNNVARAALRVARNTGVHAGKGFHRYTRELPADEIMTGYVYNDAALNWQETRFFGFRWFSAYQQIAGEDVEAIIQVNKLIQEDKDEATGRTATVHEINPIGDDKYEVILKNATHRWSYVGGDPGARYDVIKEWEAGGHFVRPPDWAQVDSVYEDGISIGGPNDYVAPGDCLSFTATLDGIDFSELRFPVIFAEAHAVGFEAPNWAENEVLRVDWEAGGYWPTSAEATTVEANTLIETSYEYGDILGTIAAPEASTNAGAIVGATTLTFGEQCAVSAGFRLKNTRTGEVVQVSSVSYGTGTMTLTLAAGLAIAVNSGDTFTGQIVTAAGTSTPYTRVAGNTLPALSTGQYWQDRNRLYFSTADAGASVDIRYTVDGLNQGTSASAFAQLAFTIPSSPQEFVTPFSYSDVSGATVTVTADGDTLSEAGGGSPAAGEYKLVNNGGQAAIQTNLAERGQTIVLRAELPTALTTSPGNVTLCGDYENFGKLRDRVVIKDTAGWLADYYGDLADVTTTQIQNAGVLSSRVVPTVKVNGTALPDNAIVWDAGSGRIGIKPLNLTEDEGNRITVTARLMDHRARPSAETINELIDGVDLLLGTQPFTITQGDGAGVAVEILMDEGWTEDQLQVVDQCPTNKFYAVTKGQLPRWGIWYESAAEMYDLAGQLRWYGRGGYVWGSGYADFDTSGATAGDLTISGAAPPHPWSVYNYGSSWYTVADPWAYGGAAYPTSPTIPDNLRVGGVGGPTDVDAFEDGRDLDCGGVVKQRWFASDAGTPFGWRVLAVENDGWYGNYPFYATVPSGINRITGGPIFVGSVTMAARMDFELKTFRWDEKLWKFPDGTTVDQAFMRIKVTGLTKTIRETACHYDNSGNRITDTDSTVTSTEGVHWVLFGRKSVAGYGNQWEALGGSIASTVNNGKWQYVDVTELVNAFLSTWRKSEYDQFALAPSPAVSQVGVMDHRAFMRSLLPQATWGAYYASNTPSYYVFTGSPGGDRVDVLSAHAETLQWSTITLGDGILVGIQYPESEKDRALQVGHLPPMDTPGD